VLEKARYQPEFTTKGLGLSGFTGNPYTIAKGNAKWDPNMQNTGRYRRATSAWSANDPAGNPGQWNPITAKSLTKTGSPALMSASARNTRLCGNRQREVSAGVLTAFVISASSPCRMSDQEARPETGGALAWTGAHTLLSWSHRLYGSQPDPGTLERSGLQQQLEEAIRNLQFEPNNFRI